MNLLKKWSLERDTIFVATLGANGSVAYQRGVEYTCKAEKVSEIVDTTGCGDSYQAGFIGNYLLNKDIEKAMREGARVASKTLTHFGGFSY